MEIVLFVEESGLPVVGIRRADTITSLGMTMAALLHEPLARIRGRVEQTSADEVDTRGVSFLAPIDGRTELWAAGVTYEISQQARMEESREAADVYERVYHADRPELFFKAPAWRVVGDGGVIRARADSEIDVPEPELAVLLNAHAETVGFAVCNDMSSRSIEGENPLYLPQAKIYRGSAALGPHVVPAWHVADPHDLGLRARVLRGGATAWEGVASTARLHRRIDDLARWLFRELDFPDGVWLSTGTCLVPDYPFSVRDGDEVEIEIESVGRLVNTVRRDEPSP